MSSQGPPEERPAKEPAKPRSNRELLRTGLWVVLAIYITLFAAFNSSQVDVNWVFGSGHAPLIIVIVISLLVGIVLTYFAERRNKRKR
jgi:uncharacterized integral membrane protein